MKQLNQYIQEKLKINSKSKVEINYNPDELNNKEVILYKSNDDKYNIYDLDLTIEDINNNKDYFYFIVTRFNPLSKIKDFDNDFNDYSDDLLCIYERIMDQKSLTLDFEVRLKHGHLEFDCINKKSKKHLVTYYVYAINRDISDDVENWFDTPEDLDGNTSQEKLQFLFNKGNILEINI